MATFRHEDHEVSAYVINAKLIVCGVICLGRS